MKLKVVRGEPVNHIADNCPAIMPINRYKKYILCPKEQSIVAPTKIDKMLPKGGKMKEKNSVNTENTPSVPL